jgi:hypothetical protein
MPELLGSLVVATCFLSLVVRDALIAHGRVVRSVEHTSTGDEGPSGDGERHPGS